MTLTGVLVVCVVLVGLGVSEIARLLRNTDDEE